MDRLFKISVVVINLLVFCQGFMNNPRAIISTSSQSASCVHNTAYKKNVIIYRLPRTSITMLSGEMSSFDQSIFLIAETEGWRQYVPLVVSVGVILDILLGSPLANLALGPMRRAAMKNEDNSNEGDNDDSNRSLFGGGSGSKSFKRNPKERIDTEAVGLAALEKARNSMELRKFLEENKTDEQRYEEIRKKIDAEAAKFDEKIKDSI